MQSRRGLARIRRWALIMQGSVGLLVAAYLINLATWDTSTVAAESALAQTKEQIKDTTGKIAKLRGDLREQQAVLRANKAVGEQPDWGSLLSLLASTLGDNAVLTEARVEPVAVVPVPTPVTAKSAPALPEGSRPQKLKLTIKGMSRTQDAASKFVISLEKTKVFDKVTLVETKRSEPSNENISFEIACDLTDSGAMTK
jgi:Tfp pilus assembly protein PilN